MSDVDTNGGTARRRREAGEVATIHDLAKAEGFTDRFVGRTVRLPYLSPDVLERLVIIARQSG